MARRAKWADQEERRERSGLGWWAAQAEEPTALRVSVQVEEPTTPSAPAWVELRLPDGALVRVLPDVDAVTFACVLAVAAELSAKWASPAALAVHVASRRGSK